MKTMKTSMLLALAAVSLTALSACNQEADDVATAPAATGIDGTWVADLSTVKLEGSPDELLLKDGTYTCSTCVPPLTIPADGEYHDVTGRDYSDAIAVKVDSDSQVTMRSKKGDQEMGSSTYTVAPDGKTMTQAYTDTSVPNAPPVTGKTTMNRVGEAPAGAHAISGKWQTGTIDNVSQEGLTVTFVTTGDTLKMSSPDGTGFEAKLDGTDAPISGDMANTMVSVTKTGENSWTQVTKRDGKVVGTTEFNLDGDTLHVVSTNERTGDKTSYDARRQ